MLLLLSMICCPWAVQSNGLGGVHCDKTVRHQERAPEKASEATMRAPMAAWMGT